MKKKEIIVKKYYEEFVELTLFAFIAFGGMILFFILFSISHFGNLDIFLVFSMNQLLIMLYGFLCVYIKVDYFEQEINTLKKKMKSLDKKLFHLCDHKDREYDLFMDAKLYITKLKLKVPSCCKICMIDQPNDDLADYNETEFYYKAIEHQFEPDCDYLGNAYRPYHFDDLNNLPDDLFLDFQIRFNPEHPEDDIEVIFPELFCASDKQTIKGIFTYERCSKEEYNKLPDIYEQRTFNHLKKERIPCAQCSKIFNAWEDYVAHAWLNHTTTHGGSFHLNQLYEAGYMIFHKSNPNEQYFGGQKSNFAVIPKEDLKIILEALLKKNQVCFIDSKKPKWLASYKRIKGQIE